MTDNEIIKREYEKHGGAPITHEAPDDGMPFSEAKFIFGIVLSAFGLAAIILTVIGV